jgi:hypothetical protein
MQGTIIIKNGLFNNAFEIRDCEITLSDTASVSEDCDSNKKYAELTYRGDSFLHKCVEDVKARFQ